jgi:hypothetical protein
VSVGENSFPGTGWGGSWGGRSARLTPLWTAGRPPPPPPPPAPLPHPPAPQELRPLFESVGQVMELVVVRDKTTHESKGSAFVW